MRKQSQNGQKHTKYCFQSIIEQIMTVGLQEHCRGRPQNHQLKWITTLQIVSQRTFDLETNLPQTSHNRMVKYIEIGNEFYLKIHFCEKQKKPITKIKSAGPANNKNYHTLPYPNQIYYDQFLCFEIDDKPKVRKIIEDLQMVEVSTDNEFDVPDQENYQVVRLPVACQTAQQENSSNQQLIQKTRYLLVKSIDLEDHESIVQYFQPQATSIFLLQNSNVQIDLGTFDKFCFPEGVALDKSILEGGHHIFNFILTQQDGSRVYINCLKFKQQLPTDIVDTLPSNCVDKHLHEHQVLYAEKAFCIASKYCYTDFFHNLLEEIFRKYQSLQNVHHLRIKNTPKSEGFIQSTYEISFENVGRQFIKKYKIGLIEIQKAYFECQYMKQALSLQIEWNHNKIYFPQAHENLASLYSPRAVYCLFKVLSAHKIVQLVQSLLLERKIVFVSDSQIVLGYVIESLLSFLYPLRWEHPILPILSDSMVQLLQAPMPLIAGLPTSMATDDLIVSLTESTVVFLDCNELLTKDHTGDMLQVNHIRQAMKKLRVYDIYSKDHVAQMLQFKEHFYMFKLRELEESTRFNTQIIKHIFLQTILLLLRNYNRFYSCQEDDSNKLNNKLEQRKCATSPVRIKQQFNFKKNYRIEDFIKSHPRNLHIFMRKFTQCTHFVNFIYRNYDHNNNPQKKFIDIALLNQMNKSHTKLFAHQRLSEPVVANTEASNNLKKKTSFQPSPNHNVTWSPPSRKSVDSTNYSQHMDKRSLRSEDVELEKEKTISEEDEPDTKGSQICKAISRAIQNASHTQRNVIMWTQARVFRLKKYFAGKDKEEKEKNKSEKPEIQEQIETTEKIDEKAKNEGMEDNVSKYS